jgi:hypothetical protein
MSCWSAVGPFTPSATTQASVTTTATAIAALAALRRIAGVILLLWCLFKEGKKSFFFVRILPFLFISAFASSFHNKQHYYLTLYEWTTISLIHNKQPRTFILDFKLTQTR